MTNRKQFLLIKTYFIVCVIITNIVFAEPTLLAVSSGQFSHPHDLTLDVSEQYLYVADMQNDEIKVLDANTLQVVNQFGKGELSQPHDVAFRNAEELLVADSGNNRIVTYIINGYEAKFSRTLVSGISSPEGVTLDSAGNVFVTITGAHSVCSVENFKIKKQAGSYGKGKNDWIRPHDIEYASDGFLYVADPGNNRIKKMDSQMRVQSIIGGQEFQFNEPKYFALDETGKLYVADQYNNLIRIFNEKLAEVSRIENYTHNGKLIRFNKPEGVEVKGNKIWISDTYNDTVVLFKLQ